MLLETVPKNETGTKRERASEAKDNLASQETEQVALTEKNRKPISTEVAKIAKTAMSEGDKSDKLKKASPSAGEPQESKYEYIPESVFTSLPTLLKDSCKIFVDRRERDVYLSGALSVLGGCFYNVSAFNDVDKKGVSTNLLSFIVAPPASGKGALKYAKKLAMKIAGEYAVSKSIDDKGPWLKLMIPANISSAGLMQILNENSGIGIIIESEIDTLVNATKQEWGNYSDILRNCFENETISLYRKTKKEHAEIDNLRLSLAISGTNNQFKALMKSAENGLFSRGCYYVFDNTNSQLQCFGRLKADKDVEQHFANVATDYYNTLLKFESVKVVFSKEQLTRVERLLQQEFNQVLKCIDIHANVKRAFVSVQKIASVLSCLWECEKKTLKATFNCADKTLETALDIMMVYLRHSYKAFELLPKINALSLTVNQQRLLAVLPTEFKRGDALKHASEIGISIKTVDNAIKAFKEKKIVEQMKFGQFKKLDT